MRNTRKIYSKLQLSVFKGTVSRVLDPRFLRQAIRLGS
jgi:hypothetical protein